MRLLTRSDFDGLACGTLLKALGLITKWKFVHPKDLQDGLVEINDDDILCNVPYAEGCKMWFDHHSSEVERLDKAITVDGECRIAPSCARVVYEYYTKAGHDLTYFDEMIKYVDKVDSGDLTAEEIQNPSDWILLGLLMDPRTGLGRFRDFRISNYELMELLMEVCRTKDIKEIMQLEDVKERVELYQEQNELFKQMILAHTRTDANVIITDLRGVQPIYTGNRFLIYSLFPQCNISLWIVDGRGKLNCPIAVGHSILNRSSNTNVGSLMLKNGGGGHKQVGTCQVPYDDADKVINELIATMKTDG
ncbi:MAG: exopolyphosphatase [Defluviitaleaceae bacterium]|nr:exopolyphosphatase [Defluviitaleaceae bacterium]